MRPSQPINPTRIKTGRPTPCVLMLLNILSNLPSEWSEMLVHMLPSWHCVSCRRCIASFALPGLSNNGNSCQNVVQTTWVIKCKTTYFWRPCCSHIGRTTSHLWNRDHPTGILIFWTLWIGINYLSMCILTCNLTSGWPQVTWLKS